MAVSFSALTEGWIPVVTFDGEYKKLGILDTLRDAHKLKEITDASPMVEYSLYRFLSVFLMDALRPKTIDDLDDILQEECFPADLLDDYIAECREEGVTFDFFDSSRPFLQTPLNTQWDKTIKPVTALDYTVPSGNNHTHFDHRKQAEQKLTYDEAVRLLLPAQMFCTAGVQGYPSNVYASPPFFLVIKGENLFQTLGFSMIPTQRIDLPFDTPPVFWRNTEPVEPKKDVVQTSWLFGMLFPARRITLIPEEDGVAETYLCQGMNYRSKETWRDPFVTYRNTDKGMIPWRPNQEKAVWRNMSDLIDTISKRAADVLRQFFRELDGADHASVTLYGVQTNQASYLGTAHYDLTVPGRLAEDEDRVKFLGRCIQISENMAKALKHSLSGIKEIPEDIVSQAVTDLFNTCEPEFLNLCNQSLVQEKVDLKQLAQKWLEFVEKTVWDIRNRSMASLFLPAKAMSEAAKKEKEIYITLRKLKEVNDFGES